MHLPLPACSGPATPGRGSLPPGEPDWQTLPAQPVLPAFVVPLVRWRDLLLQVRAELKLSAPGPVAPLAASPAQSGSDGTAPPKPRGTDSNNSRRERAYDADNLS